MTPAFHTRLSRGIALGMLCACLAPAALAQASLQAPTVASVQAPTAADTAVFTAPSVSLQGMLGNQALLVVGKEPPRAVPPGSTHQGVKVLSTNGDEAVVEVAGERRTLRVGETPVSITGPSVTLNGQQVVLSADSRGHFLSRGFIANRPVQFMVDTGASVVSLSQAEADRLKLNYRQGVPVQVSTANGAATGWMLKLHSVRLGDVTTYDVDAVVTPAAMPVVLLGNSYLNRFRMHREGDRMTLTRR